MYDLLYFDDDRSAAAHLFSFVKINKGAFEMGTQKSSFSIIVWRLTFSLIANRIIVDNLFCVDGWIDSSRDSLFIYSFLFWPVVNQGGWQQPPSRSPTPTAIGQTFHVIAKEVRGRALRDWWPRQQLSLRRKRNWWFSFFPFSDLLD